ncbi:unnamed protein product [Toxocara canis]|uniref:Uncharacterized protein n=1 Tax=Toxocara canis TaxID=6265 RepID=A0A3P7FIM9_TOXCA|nr:unnamed protein product [Toxocara canis]
MLKVHMEDRSVIISILIAINLFACLIACSFLFLCLARRKFGTLYDLILHGYLLSMVSVMLINKLKNIEGVYDNRVFRSYNHICYQHSLVTYICCFQVSLSEEKLFEARNKLSKCPKRSFVAISSKLFARSLLRGYF